MKRLKLVNMKSEEQKLAEAKLLLAIKQMCEQSLPPDLFEQWGSIMNMLVENRGLQTVRTPKESPVKNEPFRKELESILNKYSMEHGSNTPDYILSEFLFTCLKAFDNGVNLRCGHYLSFAESNK